jgi:DHA1 family bicyclomycin/chloramphenicol resistance-like MFS transporter
MKENILRSSASPLVPLCLLVLGASLWPELELLVPSLPTMKEFFAVSEGEIQQLLGTNFIGFLAGVLLAGPLCDSLGRRRVALAGMMVFLLVSVYAPFASSFQMMLLVRFIQGFAVTGPIIGGSTMLMEHTFGAAQIFWMSMANASITLCMALAPIVGSLINNSWGFSGNLWAIFIVALIGIIPFLFFVPESLNKESRKPFKMREVTNNYWQLLKNRRFVGLSLVISALPAAYWIYTGVSSLYLIDYLKLDPALFGRYQGPIVGVFALLSIGINWIHQRVSLKICLLVGFFSMLVGVLFLVVFSCIGYESALGTTIFMMFFVGGMVPACSLLFASALNQLPANLQGSGQSLIQALRLLLSSIGTIILGITYSGPFLPVALILLAMLLLSSILLFKMRHLISDQQSAIVGAGH